MSTGTYGLWFYDNTSTSSNNEGRGQSYSSVWIPDYFVSFVNKDISINDSTDWPHVYKHNVFHASKCLQRLSLSPPSLVFINTIADDTIISFHNFPLRYIHSTFTSSLLHLVKIDYNFGSDKWSFCLSNRAPIWISIDSVFVFVGHHITGKASVCTGLIIFELNSVYHLIVKKFVPPHVTQNITLTSLAYYVHKHCN